MWHRSVARGRVDGIDKDGRRVCARIASANCCGCAKETSTHATSIFRVIVERVSVAFVLVFCIVFAVLIAVVGCVTRPVHTIESNNNRHNEINSTTHLAEHYEWYAYCLAMGIQWSNNNKTHQKLPLWFFGIFCMRNMDAFGVFRVVVACIMLIISLLINIPFEPEKHSKSPGKKTSTGSQ